MTAAATVLTVDDDPLIRADLRLVLDAAGFDVCGEARDGVEAVELARARRPDVIVLDLALPRLDGVEATRRILGEREVPIVALTGYGTEKGGIAQRAVEAGVLSVVRKPFSDSAVVSAVTEALAVGVSSARQVSRDTIGEVLVLLGYPESYAERLEADAFAQGRVWRRVENVTPSDR